MKVGSVEGTTDGIPVGSLDGSPVCEGGLFAGAISGLSSSMGDSVDENVGIAVVSVGLTPVVGKSDIVGKNVGVADGTDDGIEDCLPDGNLVWAKLGATGGSVLPIGARDECVGTGKTLGSGVGFPPESDIVIGVAVGPLSPKPVGLPEKLGATGGSVLPVGSRDERVGTGK